MENASGDGLRFAAAHRQHGVGDAYAASATTPTAPFVAATFTRAGSVAGTATSGDDRVVKLITGSAVKAEGTDGV
jgi:hypothetical protein